MYKMDIEVGVLQGYSGYCFLTANLDSNLAPSEGFTVVESEDYYNCPLEDGELINYTPPKMDTPSTAGAVSINGIMYDIYTSNDVYGEEIDSPYWPYNIEDWEDDMED